jgi:hypothetical protein
VWEERLFGSAWQLRVRICVSTWHGFSPCAGVTGPQTVSPCMMFVFKSHGWTNYELAVCLNLCGYMKQGSWGRGWCWVNQKEMLSGRVGRHQRMYDSGQSRYDSEWWEGLHAPCPWVHEVSSSMSYRQQSWDPEMFSSLGGNWNLFLLNMNFKGWLLYWLWSPLHFQDIIPCLANGRWPKDICWMNTKNIPITSKNSFKVIFFLKPKTLHFLFNDFKHHNENDFGL